MKIHFDFTLDEFQSDALHDCIQKEIVNLTSAKLDHFDSQPHKDCLDSHIKYLQALQQIIIAGQTRT